MPRRSTYAEFVARVKDGLAPGSDHGLVIPRVFPGALRDSTKDEETALVSTWLISTGDRDRADDRINPNGWELDNFRMGGAVLFGHNHTGVELSGGLPIAKPLQIGVDNDALVLRMQHTTEEQNPFGWLVWQLVLDGFLRSNSVGFLPKEWEWIDWPDGGWGIHFIRQELLEDSIVPVPCNPHALIDDVGKSKDLSYLFDWHRRALDGEVPDLGVPRDEIHASLCAMKGRGAWIGASALKTIRDILNVPGTSQTATSGTEGDSTNVEHPTDRIAAVLEVPGSGTGQRAAVTPFAASALSGTQNAQDDVARKPPCEACLQRAQDDKTVSDTTEPTPADCPPAGVRAVSDNGAVTPEPGTALPTKTLRAVLEHALTLVLQEQSSEDISACGFLLEELGENTRKEFTHRKLDLPHTPVPALDAPVVNDKSDVLFTLADDSAPAPTPDAQDDVLCTLAESPTINVSDTDTLKAQLATMISEQIKQGLSGFLAP